MPTHEVRHGDRTLHVHEDGAPDGRAVFFHHGTPACGQFFPPVAADARQRGLRLLGIDRPGYGGSTRWAGRAVATAAADVAAVADALGVERFATMGVSGGGPHALATAALLGDRVTACASIASIAPFDAAGLNYFAGMGRENLVEFGAALQGESALAPLLEEMAEGMRAADADGLADAIGSLVGEADRSALDRAQAEFLVDNGRRALAPGLGGWLDDDGAFVAPWGFDVAAIAVPVLVQHGRDDRFVPVAHGEWLGRAIPGADVQILNRDGHLSLVRHAGAVHQWVLDQAW